MLELLPLFIIGLLGWWHGRRMYELGREHAEAEQRLEAQARRAHLRVLQGGQARRRRAE